MSLPLSHPARQQLLRLSQVLLHRRKIWLKLRQKAYDLRDRNEAESYRKIKSARAEGDDALALAIEEHRTCAFIKEKAAIDRFNFNCPVDVSEATQSAFEEQKLQALLASSMGIISDSEILNPAKLLAALAFSVAIPIPPGDFIRSTPRRAGAPSASLPH